MVELIAKAISDGDLGFGKAWIDKYLQFMMKLPCEICIPTEFMKEMGTEPYNITKPLPCFCCGIVDCVPHNILIDEHSNKYYIIDNELTFSFPIPISFLVWRAIRTLVIDLQEYIQSHVCKERPVILLSGHGVNRHYMPLSWLDVLENLDIPPKQQAYWSSAFQNRILRYKSKPHSRLKANPRVLTHVSITETKIDQGMIRRIYSVLRKIRRAL